MKKKAISLKMCCFGFLNYTPQNVNFAADFRVNTDLMNLGRELNLLHEAAYSRYRRDWTNRAAVS
jgi:hypothetical protein